MRHLRKQQLPFKLISKLGKGLKLLNVNGVRFEISRLLAADDTVLVADPEMQLCRLVSEFGRACW